MKKIVYFFFFFLLISCSNKPKDNKEDIYESGPLDKLSNLDTKLGVPQPGDWLYAHQEPGQSFIEYKEFSPIHPNDQQNCIYIQPIGDFSILEAELVKDVTEYIGVFYGLHAKTNPGLSRQVVPDRCIRFNSNRGEQFLTHYIMDSILPQKMGGDALLMMAITNKDLYAGFENNFVFGQAHLKKRTGVSSYRRFYENELDSTKYKKCLERIMKTTTHEMGHMLGMKHCTYALCLMNGSNTLEELDRRPHHLCSECTKKMYWNIQFPLNKRYEDLKAFYLKFEFDGEYDFIIRSQEVLLDGTKNP